MPAPSRAASVAVLYELGVALEGVGEAARALPCSWRSSRRSQATAMLARGWLFSPGGKRVTGMMRLLLIVFYVEVGLVLAVAPWSAYWSEITLRACCLCSTSSSRTTSFAAQCAGSDL
jgi:hypothetical protein